MNLLNTQALLITNNAWLRDTLQQALHHLDIQAIAHAAAPQHLNPLPSPAQQPLILCEVQPPKSPALDWASAVRVAEARARYNPTTLLLAVAAAEPGWDPILPSQRQLARRAGFLEHLGTAPSAETWAERLDPWSRHLLPVPNWLHHPQDRPGLDILVLRQTVGSDPAVLHDLLCEFQRSAETQLGDLVQGQHAGDVVGQVTAVHKLKSSARTVGAIELALHCEALEARLEDHAHGGGPFPALNDLLGCWAALKEALNPRV